MTTLRTPRDDMHDVIAFAAWAYDVSLGDILSPSRRYPVVAARHAAMRTIRNGFPSMSTPAIGRLFKRNHTTVCHALGTLKNKKPLIDWQGGEPVPRVLSPMEASVAAMVLEHGPIRRREIYAALHGDEDAAVKSRRINVVVHLANGKLAVMHAAISHDRRGYFIAPHHRAAVAEAIARANSNHSRPAPPEKEEV